MLLQLTCKARQLSLSLGEIVGTSGEAAGKFGDPVGIGCSAGGNTFKLTADWLAWAFASRIC